MKLASFFVLSVGLHASALVYPFELFVRHPARPIRVTILPVEQGSGGTAGPAAQDRAARARTGSNSLNPSKSNMPSQPVAEPKSADTPSPQPLRAETTTAQNERARVLISSATSSSDRYGEATSARLGGSAQAPGPIPGGGAGSSGRGMASAGRGTGFGNGSGAEDIAALTEARYSHGPKPEYPESARRQGREGRVLLRVLVDERGRTKSVEVRASSGDESLDRAAVDAVQRWRFHPGRSGDKAIESWLRVPIEFRLDDAQTW
jgi:protein TonB